MRKFHRVLTVILFVVVIQSFTTMAFAKTEHQKYRVIHTEKEFEIRFYPSATLATVYSDARSYSELSGSGFRKLAGFIFGGNETGTKIAMTAPVHMDITQSGSSMSFVMPGDLNREKLPEPKDNGVKIEQTKDEYVAAIQFGGYASDKDISFYSEKLKKLLDEKGITYYGHFRYLGYNPPFQPFWRRNEIIVSVRWAENTEK
jgi:hypothetical protein